MLMLTAPSPVSISPFVLVGEGYPATWKSLVNFINGKHFSARSAPPVFHLKAGSFVHLRFTGAAHKINGNCSAQCTRQSKAIQASEQEQAETEVLKN